MTSIITFHPNEECYEPLFRELWGRIGPAWSTFRAQGWKFLLTSFEEKIKPRYQRDLRRHLIGRPMYSDRGELTATGASSCGPLRKSPTPRG